MDAEVLPGDRGFRQITMLLHPFPARLVKDNPNGYGTYVAHPFVEQRLIDVLGHPPETSVAHVIRGGAPGKSGKPNLENVVVGVVLRMAVTIDGTTVVVEEAGDCDNPSNWNHDGARLKDAMSDAYKAVRDAPRCRPAPVGGRRLLPGRQVAAPRQRSEGNEGRSPYGGTGMSGDKPIRAERGGWWPSGAGNYGVRLLDADGCHFATIWRPTATEADAVIAQINGTPDPELPEGVHAAAGGGRLFVLPGFGLPVGWQWRWTDGGPWRDSDGTMVYDTQCAEVRPIPPAPAAVKVPWHEAMYRHLPSGHQVTETRQTKVHPEGEVWTLVDGWLRAASDGTVEVLPLPEDGEGS